MKENKNWAVEPWLNHDHKQFESAVYCCRSVCDDEDWGTVRNLFQDFLSSYVMHMQLEEDVLFPMYEERAETPTGAIISLREDHAQILGLAKHIRDLLERGDTQSVPNHMSSLYRLVTKHHKNEEEIFLPMARETLLSDKDKMLSELKPRSDLQERQ